MKYFIYLSILSLGFCYGNYTTSPNPSLLSMNASHHIPMRTKNYPGIGNARIAKKGVSCMEGYVLANSIVYDGIGKSSIDDAMKQGGIKKAAIIDYKSTQLGLFGYVVYSEECIYVYGE